MLDKVVLQGQFCSKFSPLVYVYIIIKMVEKMADIKHIMIQNWA